MGHPETRRQFLRKSLLGLTGIPLLNSCPNPRKKIYEISNQNEVLKYRTLGKTGIKIPILSMGTGNWVQPNLIKAAITEGLTFFSTSQVYSNGNVQRMLGRILQEYPRDSYFIATSVRTEGIDSKAGLYTKEADPVKLKYRLDESLKDLRRENVDIFILPYAARRESVFFEPYLRAMEDIKKQGKARYIGIATHSYEAEAIRAAKDTKIYDVVMTSYNYRQDHRQDVTEAIDYAANAGLGIIGMKTMAGYLYYWDQELKEPINTKAFLKWAFQNPNVHTVVSGFNNYEQLNENISAMNELELTPEEKLNLGMVRDRFPTGLYCQQCGRCIPQCRASLDIPSIMRSYMYAYGYRDMLLARDTLMGTGVSLITCASCRDCPIHCTKGFDIKRKITDISRLVYVPEEFLKSS